ncbi:GH92 family glycosyl hydrolase [Marinilabiliaceae bacterium ANBcel2]|nr:GH92 family glycosyl hydrolase [Marinilabiliaceae bacterium ANBcel2]
MRCFRFIFVLPAILFFLSGCSDHTKELKSLTSYVDPFIGTDEHGHVFMGANVPYGFVQLGPTQHGQGWDWCSGYHYSDSTIIGFGHMHLSGTGIGDLGDISFMPVLGEIKNQRGTLPDESTGIYSYFSHDNEVAKPGYYSVFLDRFGIKAELTTTERTGFHRYTFPGSDDSRIVIDLEHGIGWDLPVDTYITVENDSVVSGYRKSTGWAENQKVYFTAVFSKPFNDFYLFDQKERVEGSEVNVQRAYGHALFDTEENESVYVKVGLSPVSIDNAKENLSIELDHWDFDRVVAEADDAWNEQLNKIVVETDNEEYKTIFYTSLYHTMIAPSVFHDHNGDYFGSDHKIYNDNSYTNYTVFSLWDTYRAAQPLMTIIHPEMIEDVAQTMLNIYDQQGKLPVWHLMGNETNTMVGNPGIPVLADIILKGYDVDIEKAYEAMKVSALLDERGLDLHDKYGYIPFDKHITEETVAMSLEYALADWSLAQVADMLGYSDDYDYFMERSKSYQHFFDPESKFLRALSSDGERFREPFDPFKTVHRSDDYCEGTGWQYAWLVPHDVNGLIDLHGGGDKFVNKLDSLFIVEGDLGDEASPDITGLIGQYAHGNEPSHHVAYIYQYAGYQWKSAERVHEILTTMYDTTPSGLCGNEDVGQMSAWYILSAMGFYQVEPAGGKYIIGRPLMDRVTVKVKNGDFTITAHNNSDANKYIQRVKLNGKEYSKSYIMHSDIEAGGHLEFYMGNTPSDFGSEIANRP